MMFRLVSIFTITRTIVCLRFSVGAATEPDDPVCSAGSVQPGAEMLLQLGSVRCAGQRDHVPHPAGLPGADRPGHVRYRHRLPHQYIRTSRNAQVRAGIVLFTIERASP